MLKVQLEDLKASGTGQPSLGGAGISSGQTNGDLRNIKKQLTTDEQVQLQREIIQLDMIVKGYMDENQKSMRKQKDLEIQVKSQTETIQ